MSMSYCKRCDVQFDTDTTEQAGYCRHCETCMPLPIETPLHRSVRWTIRPAIGDRPIWEMDVTIKLGWDDNVGWCFDGVIADGLDGEPIPIERDGTIKRDAGWVQHAPLAVVIKIAAEHCFEADKEQITADLPSYWPTEDHDYTDTRYRRLAV